MTGSENKKGFFQNDRLLVCSMLIFYGVCGIGVITLLFGGVRLGNEFIADATATASVNATTTARAHATEQSQYEFIDRFDDNSGHWRVGEFKNNGSWEGSMEIKDGIYVLKADKIIKPFFQITDFFNELPIKDFDVYVDTKFTNEAPKSACSGLDFRRSFKGWWHGVYVFFICRDSTFIIAYYGEGGWESISNGRLNKTIQTSDWNRLEVNAYDDYFFFSINNEPVYLMTDDRLKEGALGIAIQTVDNNPTVFQFDNFGYQSR